MTKLTTSAQDEPAFDYNEINEKIASGQLSIEEK
jgi:hypothetical protein